MYGCTSACPNIVFFIALTTIFFAIDNGKYIFFYNFAAGKTKTRQQEDAHDCQD